MISPVLLRPLIVSARAWSLLLPVVPTEASIPAVKSMSVSATAPFWKPRSLWWTSSPARSVTPAWARAQITCSTGSSMSGVLIAVEHRQPRIRPE